MDRCRLSLQDDNDGMPPLTGNQTLIESWSTGMKWIDALALEEWSRRHAARDDLSDLVKRLVTASAPSIDVLRFPTGDSSQLPGYDGVLKTEESPPYVPGGLSIWEFGTGGKPEEKANEDYKARTNSPGSIDQSQATFVFVTLQRWATGHDWADKKKAQGKWKDVRALDAVDLEEWLLQRPAVAAWLARHIGLAPLDGARSTEEFWDEYSTRFERPLAEEVLLCGREQQATQLVQSLVESKARQLLIRADSPDEAIAFAVAAIRKAEPNANQFIDARTLLIETKQAAEHLAVRKGDMIFIPRGAARHQGGLLSKNGCMTIIGVGREDPSRHDLLLERPTFHQLAQALQCMGFSEQEAHHNARACGRSVTILARCIPRATVEPPAWAASERDLIPAALAGAWDSMCGADQAIGLAGDGMREQHRRTRSQEAGDLGVEIVPVHEGVQSSRGAREGPFHVRDPAVGRDLLLQLLACRRAGLFQSQWGNPCHENLTGITTSRLRLSAGWR